MELIAKLHKTPDFIFDCLTDMHKFVVLHPVIYQIDKTGDDRYLVYETLKFGLLSFSFTYPVTIEKNDITKEVIIRAIVMKLTKIEMKFVLKADNDCTIIEENIKFESPLPIKSIMQNIFAKQHTQLFKNIENKSTN